MLENNYLRINPIKTQSPMNVSESCSSKQRSILKETFPKKYGSGNRQRLGLPQETQRMTRVGTRIVESPCISHSVWPIIDNINNRIKDMFNFVSFSFGFLKKQKLQ